jgi:hypothetical protein
MHVGVDHPGEDGRRTEIDDARFGRHRNIGANIGDAVAANEDHLIRRERSGAGVKEATGSNRNDLLSGDEESRARARDAPLPTHDCREADANENNCGQSPCHESHISSP